MNGAVSECLPENAAIEML